MKGWPVFPFLDYPRGYHVRGTGGYSVREFRRLKINQKKDLRQNWPDEKEEAAHRSGGSGRAATLEKRSEGVCFVPVCVCGVGLLGAKR